jgi:hypothetical protein
MAWSRGRVDHVTRILVTGSRNWTDLHTIAEALQRVAGPGPGTTLVHGGAPGADTVAAHIAHSAGWTIEAFPADWDRFGQGAGPIRNAAMVKAGADHCLAFIRDESRGATGCARLAERAGIPVTYYRQTTTGRGVGRR